MRILVKIAKSKWPTAKFNYATIAVEISFGKRNKNLIQLFESTIKRVIMRRLFFVIATVVVAFTVSAQGNKKSGSSVCIATKNNAETITIFPADNPWNADISKQPVDPFSSQIITGLATSSLRPDFGTVYGIPYTVVCAGQPKLTIQFTDYADQSDTGKYAVPLNAPIEGNGTGDSRVISVDIENGILYELYNAHLDSMKWTASVGAIFNLNSNQMRPDSWVSADAAGLPVFAGLVRYEEILKGRVDHAIRFTLPMSFVKAAHIYPARHHINISGGQYSLPFGAKLRLKSNFDIRGFSPTNQIILNAMKKYGLILADVASSSSSGLFISGVPDERWNDTDLQNLRQLKATDFEVIKFNY